MAVAMEAREEVAVEGVEEGGERNLKAPPCGRFRLSVATVNRQRVAILCTRNGSPRGHITLFFALQ